MHSRVQFTKECDPFFVDLLIILLLIVANGVFAMSEIAVVSSRKVKLQNLAESGNARAKTALGLTESPNRFLATVQIGITLVGIFAGAYGGATLAQPLAALLDDVPGLAPYSHTISLVLVVVGITYLSLVVGELVPKRIALNAPERIAMTVAGSMHFLSIAASPFVRLLDWSTEVMLRLLRVEKSDEPAVSEAEISALLEQGAQAGVFEAAEHDIVERLFKLGDRRVSEIMTPRRDIVWLPVDTPAEVLREHLQGHPYSRFVVTRGDLDQVLGVVHTRDLLVNLLTEQKVALTALVQKPLYIPESLPALKLVEQFRATGMHFALVVDEYGSIEGLVTLNDVLEALVGDLPARGDPEAPLVVVRGDSSFLVDGLLPVDELRELLNLGALPLADSAVYRTTGGLVTAVLGHIPQVAENFTWEAWRFEVMDMDGQRVDKVLIYKLQSEVNDAGGA